MRFINVSGDSPKGVKRRGISRLQVRMHLLSAICVVFLLVIVPVGGGVGVVRL